MMTINKLQQIVDECKKHNSEFASLVQTRRPGFKLKGFRARTPFGLCQIANVQEKEYGVDIVFFVEVKKIEKFIGTVLKQWDDRKDLKNDQTSASKKISSGN